MSPSDPPTLSYWLAGDPTREVEARYALGLLASGAGVRLRPARSLQEAELVHAPSAQGVSETGIWMRSGAPGPWDAPPETLTPFAGTFVHAAPGESPPALERPDRIGADLLYTTWIVATGAHERGQSRNSRGVPIQKGGVLERSGALAVPLIATYANLLARAFDQHHPGSPRLPRWPDGKTRAVVLSHDVDLPFVGQTSHDKVRAAKNLLRTGHLLVGSRRLLGAARQALRVATGAALRPEDDPNFGFEGWFALERELGARSCFYVATWTRTDVGADSFDVEYDFAQPAMARALRRAVAEGWEVGLHASINAKTRGVEGFAREKALLEDVIGARIAGLRHHYWAMDPEVPERTLALHEGAGFEYDTSLGINDVPGFRRGACWPFRPFDPVMRRPSGILEVPPTIMDGAAFLPATRTDGPEQLRRHFDAAFRAGGAVHLDWHLEQQNPRNLGGAGPRLAEALRELRSDSTIHWTTPGALARWWAQRERSLA
ncbi:MAG TPA: hypothetical protein VFF73_26045 [Planctomycetota bacterium]|nr:hypothetical protein [Planctomycetota bacterium]